MKRQGLKPHQQVARHAAQRRVQEVVPAPGGLPIMRNTKGISASCPDRGIRALFTPVFTHWRAKPKREDDMALFDCMGTSGYRSSDFDQCSGAGGRVAGHISASKSRLAAPHPATAKGVR